MKTKKYEIIGIYADIEEIINETDSHIVAVCLREEYQRVFGKEWEIYIRAV